MLFSSDHLPPRLPARDRGYCPACHFDRIVLLGTRVQGQIQCNVVVRSEERFPRQVPTVQTPILDQFEFGTLAECSPDPLGFFDQSSSCLIVRVFICYPSELRDFNLVEDGDPIPFGSVFGRIDIQHN